MSWGVVYQKVSLGFACSKVPKDTTCLFSQLLFSRVFISPYFIITFFSKYWCTQGYIMGTTSLVRSTCVLIVHRSSCFSFSYWFLTVVIPLCRNYINCGSYVFLRILLSRHSNWLIAFLGPKLSSLDRKELTDKMDDVAWVNSALQLHSLQPKHFAPWFSNLTREHDKRMREGLPQ